MVLLATSPDTAPATWYVCGVGHHVCSDLHPARLPVAEILSKLRDVCEHHGAVDASRDFWAYAIVLFYSTAAADTVL